MKNLEIQYLRAIAVVVTIIAHSRLLYLWNPDWLIGIHENFVFGNGVDLFFVISGFVISKSISTQFNSRENFSKDYSNFLSKRFKRLAPAALFFCVFYLLYSLVTLSGEVGSLRLNLKNTVAVLTLTANLRDQSNLMSVYWTLASEWQFYILLPIFLIVIYSKKIQKYLVLLFLIFAFLFLGDTFFVKLRFDAILYGVLLFQFSQTKAYKVFEPKFLRRRRNSFIVSFTSFFLLIFLPIALTDIPKSIMMGLVSMNCTLLVWIASYNEGYLASGLLRKAGAMVGERSYSIYLAHGPSLYLTHDMWYWLRSSDATTLGAEMTSRYTLTFLLFLLITTEVSYRLLERPYFKSSGAPVSRR
jgi:peptidoglycan/LPS O-acetylase OafA/YrhL